MSTPIYPDLRNRCVLITGGATGIGAALVRAFADQGAIVFFCDVQASAGNALAEALGSNVTFSAVDLKDESQVAHWIHPIAKQHASIKVLINNAAQDDRLALSKTTMEVWDRLMAVNLRAAYLCTRIAAPFMKNNGAAIINFSSITFQLGEAGMSAYVTAKGGIVAMTRSLARELGRDRIRVNTLSPGWVMTEKQLKLYATEAIREKLRQDQCIPDLIQPEEIAEVALFLASESSRAITGQNIASNRGWMHL